MRAVPPFWHWVGPVGISGSAIPKWSFYVRWRVGPGGCSGSGVAAELRLCGAAVKTMATPMIWAVHPVWDDGT